jgi:integrase
MARVFRHTYTTKDDKGKRVRRQTRKWYIEYRDADGVVQRTPGYRDHKATEQKAAELERNVERRQSGLVDTFTEHRKRPLKDHLSDYEAHLTSKHVCERHKNQVMERLRACLKSCHFSHLQDIDPTPVERFLSLLVAEGKSLRTRNSYLESVRSFCNWCVRSLRLPSNPLSTIAMVRVQKDIRRKRRALTEDELKRLILAARQRPLTSASTITRGKRKGQVEAHLKAEYREWLDRCGHERALEYKTMVLTGLRKGELTAMAWRDLDLQGQQCWVTVRAENAKNSKTEVLPIRGDLAADLRAWRVRCGDPKPKDKVFRVPRNLVRQLRKDLKAAGISEKDHRGRIVDVHALRHTTSTHGAKAGVAPRTLQALMRHSDIRLTMGVYTDPGLLDQQAAVETLPRMEIEAGSVSDGRPAPKPQIPEGLRSQDDLVLMSEKWRDFLVFFLASDLAERGSSGGLRVSSDGIQNATTHSQVQSVKAEGAVTYDRSCHQMAASAAGYPQGDSNPCLQDENLIS